MKIEQVSIDIIRPYWRNPRKNDKAVEAVKKSIKEYGYNSPVIVDKDNVIIAGHVRYKSLRELGYTNIPVVVLDITEEKAKQYRIADNKTSEISEWDEDLLLYELREIEELDDMKIFFDKGELDTLIELKDMDFDDEDDDPFDEKEEKKVVEAKVRTEMKEELGEEYEQKFEAEKESLEKEVEERVQNEMKEQIREEMKEENERIKELEKTEQNKFAKASQEKGEDYIEVQCPHCDEEYILSRSELLKPR